MTVSILAILAAVLPLFVWLIRRHLNHEDDPYTQHAEKREEIPPSHERPLKQTEADAVTSPNRLCCASQQDSRRAGRGGTQQCDELSPPHVPPQAQN